MGCLVIMLSLTYILGVSTESSSVVVFPSDLLHFHLPHIFYWIFSKYLTIAETSLVWQWVCSSTVHYDIWVWWQFSPVKPRMRLSISLCFHDSNTEDESLRRITGRTLEPSPFTLSLLLWRAKLTLADIKINQRAQTDRSCCHSTPEAQLLMQEYGSAK